MIGKLILIAILSFAFLAPSVVSAKRADDAKALDPATIEVPAEESQKLLGLIRDDVLTQDQLNSDFPPEFWKRRHATEAPPVSSSSLNSLSHEMAFVANAFNTEEATRTPREWFLSISKALKRMSDARKRMEIAIMENKSGVYFNRVAEYVAERDALKAIVKDRPLLSNEDYKRIKAENDKIRKTLEGKK